MELDIFVLTIISGIAGTLVMTLSMYGYGSLTKSNTKVVHVLGLMVTGNMDFANQNKAKILAAGSVTHVFVGVVFSFSYFLLWNWGVFSISLIDSIIVGALTGILAIIVWGLYFKVHRNSPKASLAHYFIALFISHIIFGLVTVNVFSIIADNPQWFYQLQEEISGPKTLSIFLSLL